jgi:hypothetical protein
MRRRYDRHGNRRELVIAPHVLEQLLAHETRHQQIHEHGVGARARLEEIDRVGTGGRDVDMVAVRREQLGQRELDLAIVFDDEDAGTGRVLHHRTVARLSRSATVALPHSERAEHTLVGAFAATRACEFSVDERESR